MTKFLNLILLTKNMTIRDKLWWGIPALPGLVMAAIIAEQEINTEMVGNYAVRRNAHSTSVYERHGRGLTSTTRVDKDNDGDVDEVYITIPPGRFTASVRVYRKVTEEDNRVLREVNDALVYR